MSIDFKDMFPAEVVEVQGKPYLFTNLRINRKTVPKKLHAFDVADDSGDGEFWRIQRNVIVDHWGTIVGLEPVDLDENGQFWCEAEDDNPDLSKEGRFTGFSMEDQSDYVVYYHMLKQYAISPQTKQVGRS